MNAYQPQPQMHERLWAKTEHAPHVRVAYIKHLLAIVDLLCKRNNVPNPNFANYNSNSAVGHWLLEHFTPQQINNASDEIVEFYRRSGTPHRVHDGRGRPVGAKNKSKYETPFKPWENDTSVALPEAPNPANNDAPAQPANVDLSAYLTKQEFRTETNIMADGFARQLEGVEKTFTNIHHRLNSIQDNRPTIIELKRPELPAINAGVQHKHFPLLVQASIATLRSGNHLNIWLYGPAGTGKTTAAEKLADILFPDMPINFRYNGAIATAFQLMGYHDANGHYVTTAFREAWEHGGVYLFDEIDGSMPDALLAMNGALANSIASFPDKMVPRHPNCVIIAGANTTGLGGGTDYVGAMKQNAAFLDRFVQIPWPHDDGLEDALCANKDWLSRVRAVRANWLRQKIKGHMITMRATLYGESLLAAGMDQSSVELLTLRKGLSDDQWAQIK